jgi:hypothetical protein
MTSFTLFETFFFLTLAITFILILLIIYHFKKRLSTLEERSDKLFSIIQCMAEDLPKVPQPTHIFDNQMSSYPIPENEIHTINLEEIDDSNKFLDSFHSKSIGLEKEREPWDEEENDEEENDEEENDEEDDNEEEDDEEEDDEEEDDEEEEEDDDDEEEEKLEGDEKIVIDLSKKVIEIDESVLLEKPDTQEEYNKMSIAELKQVITNKGKTVPSMGKMKKKELLNLLSNE